MTCSTATFLLIDLGNTSAKLRLAGARRLLGKTRRLPTAALLAADGRGRVEKRARPAGGYGRVVMSSVVPGAARVVAAGVAGGVDGSREPGHRRGPARLSRRENARRGPPRQHGGRAGPARAAAADRGGFRHGGDVQRARRTGPVSRRGDRAGLGGGGGLSARARGAVAAGAADGRGARGPSDATRRARSARGRSWVIAGWCGRSSTGCARNSARTARVVATGGDARFLAARGWDAFRRRGPRPDAPRPARHRGESGRPRKMKRLIDRARRSTGPWRVDRKWPGARLY